MSLFLIAEIGINHNGDLGIAKQLIDAAVDAGFDAVKFQKRTIDVVYTKEFLDGPRESPWGTTQRDQKEGLEFTADDYAEIDRYCKSKKIQWTASAWDVDAQLFLQKFNCTFNKVASPMLGHIPLLKLIASEKKKTYISTGMSTIKEIKKAISVMIKNGLNNKDLVIFHCTSSYPTKIDDVHLKVLRKYKKIFENATDNIIQQERENKGVSRMRPMIQPIPKPLNVNKMSSDLMAAKDTKPSSNVIAPSSNNNIITNNTTQSLLMTPLNTDRSFINLNTMPV